MDLNFPLTLVLKPFGSIPLNIVINSWVIINSSFDNYNMA